jgi:hypothetical protein
VQSDADFLRLLGELQQEMKDKPTDAKLPKKVGDLYFEKKKDYHVGARLVQEGRRSWRRRTRCCATRSTTAT